MRIRAAGEVGGCLNTGTLPGTRECTPGAATGAGVGEDADGRGGAVASCSLACSFPAPSEVVVFHPLTREQRQTERCSEVAALGRAL